MLSLHEMNNKVLHKIVRKIMAQKFRYILWDLCEFFQILESGDFFFF